MISYSDKPVMNLPAIDDLVGAWECQGGIRGAKAGTGNEVKPGDLILRSNRVYITQNFPESDPLRMTEKSGRWTLVDPSMTPSGMCSVVFCRAGWHFFIVTPSRR